MSLRCPRCGAPEETLFHRIWECSHSHGDLAYEKSAHLVAQARAGHEANPSLWLRGLPPSSLTCPVFRDGGDDVEWGVGDDSQVDGPCLEDGLLLVFGDGSWGPV